MAIAVLASCTLAIPTNTEIMVEDPKSFSITSTINEWWGRSSVAKKDTICETVRLLPPHLRSMMSGKKMRLTQSDVDEAREN